MVAGLASDDIGIHAGAAEVFADLVHDQDVGSIERQACHPASGHVEQFGLARFKPFGLDRFDQGGFIMGVLDNSQTAADPDLAEDLMGDAAHDAIEAMVDDGSVIDFGSGMFSQADEHHLHQAAFESSCETGMRFDSANDQHVVRFGSDAIEMHIEAFGGSRHDDRVHGSSDGAAAGLFGDAESCEDSDLPFGRAATMASHRRDDKRFGTEGAEVCCCNSQDRRDIGNASAAGGDSDRVSRFDAALQSQASQLSMGFGFDIFDSRCLKPLADSEDIRQREV